MIVGSYAHRSTVDVWNIKIHQPNHPNPVKIPQYKFRLTDYSVNLELRGDLDRGNLNAQPVDTGTKKWAENFVSFVLNKW